MVITIIEPATSGRITVIVRLVLTVTPDGGCQNRPSSPLVHCHAGGDETFIVRHGDCSVWNGGRMMECDSNDPDIYVYGSGAAEGRTIMLPLQEGIK